MIRIGRQIVAGSATIDPSEYLKSNVPNSNVWIGNETEYEELSDIVKNDTKITFITYEDESAVSWIVDNVISYSKTWSSVKISTQLANKLNASQAYTKSEVDALLNAKLSSVYKYCGKVASASYLPSGASNGDLYFVADESVNYVWNTEDSKWDKMSSLVDLTNYITSAGLEAILANYAEKFQFVTMPTASATYEDKVVQFIGDTTQDYTKGSFYQCQNNSGTYSWSNLSVCRAITTLYDNTSSGLAATNVQAAIDESLTYTNSNFIKRVVHQAPGDDSYFRFIFKSNSYLNGTIHILDRTGNEYVISVKSGTPTDFYRVNNVTASTEYIKEIRYVTENIQRFHLYIHDYSWDAVQCYFISDTGSIETLDADETGFNSGTAIIWQTLTTTDDIFLIGNRQNVIGWADLSNEGSIDGSSNYANNVGRIEGHNAIVQIKNPAIGYQWPVNNSGTSNKFMDFGGAIQFFIDKVNNHLYVRYANSTDMSDWGEITTKNELKNTYALTRVDEHTCTFDLSLLHYVNNGLCLITLMGDRNLEGSGICSIGYYEGEWRIQGLTTLIDAGNVGTITASISGSTLTVSNTGVNYYGRLSINVGQIFIS